MTVISGGILVPILTDRFQRLHNDLHDLGDRVRYRGRFRD